MMNQSQMMINIGQLQQVMKNHNSQLWMNQLINLSNMMMIDQSQSHGTLNNQGSSFSLWPKNNLNVNPSGSIRSSNNKNLKVKKSIDKRKNNNRKDLPVRNRLKASRYLSKKKAPFAPRNTTSFLIRAKRSGGITSVESPSPVTPAVLDTPVFTPCREVLVDTAKEEWGVDGYGSMNGLIRLRSPGNNEKVEKRLDIDLSRFEMIYPKYGVNDHKSCVLVNRVDDQDANIAQLEEENWKLKERFGLMERDFDDMRTKLRLLEVQREGVQKFKEEIVENDSGSEVLEDGDEENKEANSGEKSLQGMEVLEGENVDVAKVHIKDGAQKIEENVDFAIEANKIQDDQV